MFREIIAEFPRGPKAGVSKRCYGVRGKNTDMCASDLYYYPARSSAFSNLEKLIAGSSKKTGNMS